MLRNAPSTEQKIDGDPSLQEASEIGEDVLSCCALLFQRSNTLKFVQDDEEALRTHHLLKMINKPLEVENRFSSNPMRVWGLYFLLLDLSLNFRGNVMQKVAHRLMQEVVERHIDDQIRLILQYVFLEVPQQ